MGFASIICGAVDRRMHSQSASRECRAPSSPPTIQLAIRDERTSANINVLLPKTPKPHNKRFKFVNKGGL